MAAFGEALSWPWESPFKEEEPLVTKKTLKSKSIFQPGKRFRLNVTGICLNVLAPWLLFTFLLHLMSFKTHYARPYYCFGLFGLVSAGAIGMGIAGVIVERNSYEGNWYKFTTLAFILAVVVGFVGGNYIYWTYSFFYYTFEGLETYPHVDPSKEVGQNLMDAGTVYFAEGTAPNPMLSWHFESDAAYHGPHTYCVAPIAKGGPGPGGTYDFWAIGMDCCSASASDFRCGEFDSGTARSALRQLDPYTRPMFALAVQQATAVYGLKVKHPLFFTWTTDPLNKVGNYIDWANSYFIVGSVAFFAANMTLVAITTFIYAQLGRGTIFDGFAGRDGSV